MTYADAFDKIKKKLAKADTKGFDKEFAIQVTISDEDAAGTFYVAYKGGEFSVEPYDYRDNSVAIDITTADFIKLVEGKLTAEKALDSGKLVAFGDSAALSYITGIVKPATRKKADTAKKEPAKKAPAKKAVKEDKPAEKKAEAKKAVKEEKPAEKKAEAKKAVKEEKPVEKKTEAKKATKEEKPAEKKTAVKKADK